MVVGEQLHPPSWSCVFCLGADICKTSHETTGWKQDSPHSHSHSDWDSVSEVKFILHTTPRPTELPLSFVFNAIRCDTLCEWRWSWELGAGAEAGAGALCGVTGKCSWETFRSAHISGMGRSRRSQEQPFDCHWEIIQFCGLHSNWAAAAVNLPKAIHLPRRMSLGAEKRVKKRKRTRTSSCHVDECNWQLPPERWWSQFVSVSVFVRL